MDQEETKTISCYSCVHFGVSWDGAFPYLCKSMNFKSRLLPSIEVRTSSGTQCRSFLEKTSEPQ